MMHRWRTRSGTRAACSLLLVALLAGACTPALPSAPAASAPATLAPQVPLTSASPTPSPFPATPDPSADAAIKPDPEGPAGPGEAASASPSSAPLPIGAPPIATVTDLLDRYVGAYPTLRYHADGTVVRLAEDGSENGRGRLSMGALETLRSVLAADADLLLPAGGEGPFRGEVALPGADPRGVPQGPLAPAAGGVGRLIADWALLSSPGTIPCPGSFVDPRYAQPPVGYAFRERWTIGRGESSWRPTAGARLPLIAVRPAGGDTPEIAYFADGAVVFDDPSDARLSYRSARLAEPVRAEVVALVTALRPDLEALLGSSGRTPQVPLLGAAYRKASEDWSAVGLSAEADGVSPGQVAEVSGPADRVERLRSALARLSAPWSLACPGGFASPIPDETGDGPDGPGWRDVAPGGQTPAPADPRPTCVGSPYASDWAAYAEKRPSEAVLGPALPKGALVHVTSASRLEFWPEALDVYADGRVVSSTIESQDGGDYEAMTGFAIFARSRRLTPEALASLKALLAARAPSLGADYTFAPRFLGGVPVPDPGHIGVPNKVAVTLAGPGGSPRRLVFDRYALEGYYRAAYAPLEARAVPLYDLFLRLAGLESSLCASVDLGAELLAR